MLEGAAFATEKAREFVSGTGGVISKARSIVAGDAQFFSVAPKIDDLRYALASESVFDKRDAMKRIVAQMCKGVSMHALFPDVVKNIHVPSMELRKLIYLFVVHYASDCPNEALLSISAFQKDLVDASMHVRSLALRMLCAMRIPAIHPVVMVAVKKCSTDGAPIVRKTAAIALLQMLCVCGRDADMASILGVMRELLDDKSPDVVGAAVMAFEKICPHRIDILHPVYRHLCEILPDCEEWGQDTILRVLLRYARTQFCDPHGPASGRTAGASDDSESDSEEDTDSDATTSSSSSRSGGDLRGLRGARPPSADAEAPLDPDHQLLLNAARPLLFSMNSSVVVGVCALYLHCAPARYLDYCVKPLMRILRGTEEGHGVLLNTIHSFISKRPQAFSPYLCDFYLLPQDSADVRALKHRILVQLATRERMPELFQEYKAYVRAVDEESVAEAVHGIGLLVSKHPSSSPAAMRLLTPLLSRNSQPILTEAVVVLRLLVMQGKVSPQCVQLVFKLMQQAMSGELTSPPAVSTVLWLVGEMLHVHPAIATAAPDCFRVFLRSFTVLDASVKHKVLALGCRIWLALDGSSAMAERFRGMFFYALELARYDEDYTIRDQARWIERTTDRNGAAFAEVKASFESEKPLPRMADPYAERSAFELGTFSNFFGASVLGYEELPPWRVDAPDPAIRRPLRAAVDSTTAGTWSSAFTQPWASKKKRGAGQLPSWSSSSSSAPSSAARGTGADNFYGSEDSSDDDDDDDDESDDAGSSSSASTDYGDEAESSSSASISDGEGDALAAAPPRPALVKMTIRPPPKVSH